MRFDRRRLLAATAMLPALASARVATAQPAGWELLTPTGEGPPARWDHALLADERNGRLLVFGGRDGTGASMNDLWSYDLAGGIWSPVDAVGPSPRFGVAAAPLPDGSGFLLFAGEDGATFFADLWSFDYDSDTWTLLANGAEPGPSPRYGFGGAFDAAGRFIVSHGFTFEGRFDDTWAFDRTTNTWSNITPETRPLPRCLHEVVAVGDGSQIVLYAGCSSGYGPCPQGDVWTFDTNTGLWSQLFPEVAPPPRSNPALIAEDSGVLLVGGATDAGPAADVWRGEFVDGAFSWTEADDLANGIPARSSHDMVVAGGDRFVFGGNGVEGVLGDLWRLPADR